MLLYRGSLCHISQWSNQELEKYGLLLLHLLSQLVLPRETIG